MRNILDKPTPKILTGNGKPREWEANIDAFYDLAPGLRIVVKQGTETDGSSVPRWFWWFARPMGDTAIAALFHDFLYREQYVPKEIADSIFYQIMLDLGVNPIKARVMFYAVLIGGHAAYNRYKRGDRE